MQRINSQLPGFQGLAHNALCWITLARQPLAVDELLHALALELEQPELDRENLEDIEEILSVCAGLVVIGKDKYVTLVHYTTQQFFEENYQSYFPEAQVYITKTCLTYFSFDTFSLDLYSTCTQIMEMLTFNSFWKYAAKY